MGKTFRQSGLGRGLSALIGEEDLQFKKPKGQGSQSGNMAGEVVPIELLKPNPDQPRRDFAPEEMKELANSISRNGVIQPLIVRPNPENEGDFQIVAGERRWRAAQMAQLHEVPVIVRELSDTESLQIAIIENIQRADLNAIEEAEAYKMFSDRFCHTQEELAEALGRSRSHIANLMRLLGLPAEVQKYVRDGLLSAGHARALVPASDPLKLANEIIKKGLSVRHAEKLVKQAATVTGQGTRKKPADDADTKVLAESLSANLNSNVRFKLSKSGKTGQIMIGFRSLKHLDEICEALMDAGSKLRDQSGLH